MSAESYFWFTKKGPVTAVERVLFEQNRYNLQMIYLRLIAPASLTFLNDCIFDIQEAIHCSFDPLAYL